MRPALGEIANLKGNQTMTWSDWQNLVVAGVCLGVVLISFATITIGIKLDAIKDELTGIKHDLADIRIRNEYHDIGNDKRLDIVNELINIQNSIIEMNNDLNRRATRTEISSTTSNKRSEADRNLGRLPVNGEWGQHIHRTILYFFYRFRRGAGLGV
jgi:hypothetical protein